MWLQPTDVVHCLNFDTNQFTMENSFPSLILKFIKENNNNKIFPALFQTKYPVVTSKDTFPKCPRISKEFHPVLEKILGSKETNKDRYFPK